MVVQVDRVFLISRSSCGAPRAAPSLSLPSSLPLPRPLASFGFDFGLARIRREQTEVGGVSWEIYHRLSSIDLSIYHIVTLLPLIVVVVESIFNRSSIVRGTYRLPPRQHSVQLIYYISTINRQYHHCYKLISRTSEEYP
jgi:hypothetical protein